MVSINKNLASDNANSVVAGQDTNLSNGMPWDIIDEKMEIMSAVILRQAEQIGRLKAENKFLMGQLSLISSLGYCSQSDNLNCKFRFFNEVIKKTGYYKKAMGILDYPTNEE